MEPYRSPDGWLRDTASGRVCVLKDLAEDVATLQFVELTAGTVIAGPPAWHADRGVVYT